MVTSSSGKRLGWLRSRRSRWFRALAFATVIVFFLGGLGVGVAALWAFTILPRSLPAVTALENFEPVQGTKVFDENDELITEFHVERRIFVPLAQLPNAINDAAIAAGAAPCYSS